jgi:hypothetical protein
MKHIHEALSHFLKSSHYRVAVLKGQWGVGKTFFWKAFFEAHRQDLKFRAYSYVSLFGAKDVAGVKQQILANFEMLDQAGLSKHLEKLGPLSTLLRSANIPLLSSSAPVAEYIESKVIENFLICFDDLERKETSLTVGAILGLVSQLKEEKSCKVVLVFNDGELDDETQKQISAYREKVVDIELAYEPTIEANLRIIWPDGCPGAVADVFQKAELNNLRVMQRVKWVIEYFEERIAKDIPDLWPSFCRKCAVLTVVHSAFSKRVTLDEILSTSYWELLFEEKQELKKREESRFEVMRQLDFAPSDEDPLIAEYLISGHADLTKWADVLRRRQEQTRVGDINQKHREIWERYHHGFVTSQSEFIDAQCEFLRKHVDELRLQDVAASVKFIKELDPKIDLSFVLSRSVERFVELNKIGDVDDLDRLGVDPSILELIQDRLTFKTQNHSMKELFVDLAGSDSWNPRDIKHMVAFTVEDYYQWITTEDSVDTVGLLREFLRRFGRETGDEQVVIGRIKDALRKVSSRSRIDRFRVEKGINLKLETAVNINPSREAIGDS